VTIADASIGATLWLLRVLRRLLTLRCFLALWCFLTLRSLLTVLRCAAAPLGHGDDREHQGDCQESHEPFHVSPIWVASSIPTDTSAAGRNALGRGPLLAQQRDA
jgi:hypothetical protein